MNSKITLSTPVSLGGAEVTELNLRRPTAGELRGVKLLDLCQMETGAVCKVLTRISSPGLSDADTARLDPADLMAIAAEIVAFLEPRAAVSPTT